MTTDKAELGEGIKLAILNADNEELVAYFADCSSALNDAEYGSYHYRSTKLQYDFIREQIIKRMK